MECNPKVMCLSMREILFFCHVLLFLFMDGMRGWDVIPRLYPGLCVSGDNCLLERKSEMYTGHI